MDPHLSGRLALGIERDVLKKKIPSFGTVKGWGWKDPLLRLDHRRQIRDHIQAGLLA